MWQGPEADEHGAGPIIRVLCHTNILLRAQVQGLPFSLRAPRRVAPWRLLAFALANSSLVRLKLTEESLRITHAKIAITSGKLQN